MFWLFLENSRVSGKPFEVLAMHCEMTTCESYREWMVICLSFPLSHCVVLGLKGGKGWISKVKQFWSHSVVGVLNNLMHFWHSPLFPAVFYTATNVIKKYDYIGNMKRSPQCNTLVFSLWLVNLPLDFNCDIRYDTALLCVPLLIIAMETMILSTSLYTIIHVKNLAQCTALSKYKVNVSDHLHYHHDHNHYWKLYHWGWTPFL